MVAPVVQPSASYSYKPVPTDDSHATASAFLDSDHDPTAPSHVSLYRRVIVWGIAAAVVVLLLVACLYGGPLAALDPPQKLAVKMLGAATTPASLLRPSRAALPLPPSRQRFPSLTIPALQQQYVELLIASMSAATQAVPASAAQYPPTAALELTPSFTALPISAADASCSSQPTAVLLLSSSTTHITGVYTSAGAGSDGGDGCALRSLSVVSGPIQQAVELGRGNDDHRSPVVRVDGVRLLPAHVAVWPLLNRGNLTMTTTSSALVVTLQLGYNEQAARFDYRLLIELPLQSATPPPPDVPLATTVRLHVASDVSGLVGAWVDDEKRAEYILPPTSSIVQHHALLESSTAMNEPSIGLDEQARALEGYSMFATPIVPFSTLPLAAVSLRPLSASAPIYSIPRIMHQNWFGPRIPPWAWINTWRREYLQRHDGWLHLLWRADSVVHLQLLDRLLWDSEDSLNGLSDISRTAMTRTYGGTYIDGDMCSLDSRPLDELYVAANTTGFYVAREKEGSDLYASSIFGAQRDHPVMRLFQLWQRNNTARDKTDMPWKRIGPGATTKAVESCLSAEHQPCAITDIPWKKFFPVYWDRQQFAVHIDAAKHPDSVMFQFGFTTNHISQQQHEALVNDRRRRRRLRRMV